MQSQNSCTSRISRRPLALLAAAATLLATGLTPARADVTSVSGTVKAMVQQFRSGSPGQISQPALQYPQNSESLPIQVVARQNTFAEDGAAAGVVAAQLEDPLELNQPNPQEFAINLALLSASPTVRHQAQAISQEVRGVVLKPADFPGHKSGDEVSLIGRVYVDGVLAMFSRIADRDLTGVSASVKVTVVKQVSGLADETLLSGRVLLTGGPSGVVGQSAEGTFPTDTLIHSNLAAFIPEFGRFEVLIVPRVPINYAYQATLGEEFTLQVTVEVEAANVEDQIGVAAIIGTPLDSIREVIAAVEGALTAQKTINALERERANPTGELAFPAAPARTALPLCGLFGVESAVGLVALAGLRLGRRPGR
jgi:hypothetical protein